MSERCFKCRAEPDGMPWWYLTKNDVRFAFCSRRCLVEHVAPELKAAVVVKQWIPTAEEEARMRE